jgi:hypothetical protein
LAKNLSDLIERAKKGYEDADSHWSSTYEAGKEDLFFLSDSEGAQWDQKSFEARKRRNKPALQIDQLTQFVNQVSNDIRMNTPSINVIPHSGGADIETAEIFQGKIRDIEQSSNGDDAYDYAVNSAIKGSIGFLRVDHRYKDDESFAQELYIERVVNPFSVMIDPSSIAPDGSDAKCGWVLDEISKEEFEKKYKGFSPVSFQTKSSIGDDKGKITLCEYFEIEEELINIAKLEDGSVVEVAEGEKYSEVREVVRSVVKRYHLSGEDVLKETTFPGKHIPLVPVYGEEAWRDGKRCLHSLIRKAKDPQRRYNFWASTEAELLMKSPKATVIAVGGTTEAYAKDYKDPDNAIVLRYDQTDARGNPAPAPQINPGPQIPSGIVNAMQRAAEDIKSTLGLYNAFIGQRSNETSGVAIKQRKMEGDRAVYHFGDNLVRSITHVGRILVSAIPVIHSEPEIIRIVGKEESSEEVGINGALVEGQERSFFLAEGKYNVSVTTGASYATMREEAAEFFQQVIQSQPQLIEVAGDLMFKFMDFPGAQALSERMKKLVPPHLLEEEAEDPAVMALKQENEQLKQSVQAIGAEMQAVKQQLENKQGELQIKSMDSQLKAEAEKAKAELEVMKLQLQEREGMSDTAIKQRELEIKEKELEIKIAELQLKEREMILNAQARAQQIEENSFNQISGEPDID